MGEQPRLQILRHGHINQYSNSMSECLGFYRDLLGANVFSEFTAPQHGASNALAVLGSACFEFFAPFGAHSMIGSWLQKHGQRWHSLEWTVPSLIDAIDVVNSRGMRITQHSVGEYIFVHPSIGQLIRR